MTACGLMIQTEPPQVLSHIAVPHIWLTQYKHDVDADDDDNVMMVRVVLIDWQICILNKELFADN